MASHPSPWIRQQSLRPLLCYRLRRKELLCKPSLVVTLLSSSPNVSWRRPYWESKEKGLLVQMIWYLQNDHIQDLRMPYLVGCGGLNSCGDRGLPAKNDHRIKFGWKEGSDFTKILLAWAVLLQDSQMMDSQFQHFCKARLNYMLQPLPSGATVLDQF